MFTEDYKQDIFRDHDPNEAPTKGSKEHEAVLAFADSVSVVIQSCNKNEYYAALELMKPPVLGTGPKLERAIQYPGTTMTIVLGSFAGRNTAIAWTGQGTACESDLCKILGFFQNTKAILGLGVAYGMDRKAVRVCDVLVAEQIVDYAERLRLQQDGFYPRRQTLNTKDDLMNIFCKDPVGWEFVCTKGGRFAELVFGQLASSPFLLDDNTLKQSIIKHSPQAKGGDMEGWVLYTHIQKDFPNVATIIIKGVADYADGTKDKRWQMTAAKAAVSYAHFRLKRKGAVFD